MTSKLTKETDAKGAKYFVTTYVEVAGHHTVHKEDCGCMPAIGKRVFLGEFASCDDALEAARNHFDHAEPCEHCSTGSV